jgi:hypothetical protein
MKTISIILSILITVLLQLPLLLIYLRPEQPTTDFLMLIALTIMAIFSQNNGRKFYNWLNQILNN